MNHRNVFQKIYDEIKYLCKIATAGSKEARQLEKVKKVFEDAYRAQGTLPDKVKYSITAEMTDAERYNDLKNKNLAVITETATSEYSYEISSLEELKKKAKGKAEKIIYPLADKLGITTKQLSHEDIDVDFVFSKNGGLKESLSKQFRYGGDYADFAKALINLDQILDSAILIEVHGDKYAGTSRANENLEAVYVLLGAFQDGANIIPVQMEIKKSSDVGGRLYMTVALTKIEADVLGSTPEKVQTRSLIPASNYSLADVVKEINPEDAHFLKYLPDDMLSASQIEAKKRAQAEDAERIKGYRYSLSPKGNIPIQYGNYAVSGRDVALDDDTPIRDDLPAVGKSNNDTELDDIPIKEDMPAAGSVEERSGVSNYIGLSDDTPIKEGITVARNDADIAPLPTGYQDAKGKQRKWVKTSTESDAVSRAILPKDLDQDKITYTPVSNKETLGNANAKLDIMGYNQIDK